MATSIARPATKTRLPGFLNVSDWKIRNKLILAFVAMVTLAVALFGFIGLPRISDAMLQQGSASLSAGSSNTARSIDQFLVSHREDIVSLSLLQSMIAYVSNPSDAQLKAYALKELKALANKKYIESLTVVEPDGTITLASNDKDINTDLNTNVRDRSYFVEAMKGNAGYISDPTISATTGQPAIYFSSPILDSGGNIRGVISSRLSLYGIWDIVEGDKDAAGPGTTGILLDENGIRIASSLSAGNRDQILNTLIYTAVSPVPPDIEKLVAPEKRVGYFPPPGIRVLPLPEVASALVTPGVTSFETSADNSTARHYAAISALSIKPWHYVLMTPLATFTGAADSMRIFLVVILVISGTLSELLSILVARTITNPINKLTQVADRISLGELDTKIDINRKDEIGELAESVGRMQASLQAAIERLRARRTT